MKIGYKGSKLGGVGVLLPVGVRNMSAVHGRATITQDGVDVSVVGGEAAARKLCKLDAENFELVVNNQASDEVAANVPVAKVAAKRGRKPKVEQLSA